MPRKKCVSAQPRRYLHVSKCSGYEICSTRHHTRQKDCVCANRSAPLRLTDEGEQSYLNLNDNVEVPRSLVLYDVGGLR